MNLAAAPGARLQRNLRLYPWLVATSGAMPWMGVFILFLSERVSLSEVLILEAWYYLAVVVLEVPSGYLSDRFSRRKVLIGAQLFFILAYGLFLLGDGFGPYFVAQGLLAAGMAFMSGTDVALHYDSARALDQTDAFGEREARARRLILMFSAAGAVTAGVLATYWLGWGYALSLVVTLAALVLAFAIEEPPRGATTSGAPGFTASVGYCFTLVGRAPLTWLFVYSVVLFALAHVPYELYQPYLSLLGEEGRLGNIEAPLAAGVLLALSMLLGAFAAGASVGMARRFGLYGLLLAGLALQLVIVGGMALAVHPLLVLLICARGMPSAIAHAPINEAIAPHVPSTHRATYLSVQSLVSRLSFSASLAVVSFGVPLAHPAGTPSDTLSRMLTWFLAGGLAATLALLWLLWGRTRQKR